MEFRKHIEKKYLDLIASEKKKYECRLARGDWSKMCVGDTLILFCEKEKEEEKETVVCKIEEIQTTKDGFGFFYNQLKNELLPEGEDASIYDNIYPLEEQKACGTFICFKLGNLCAIHFFHSSSLL